MPALVFRLLVSVAAAALACRAHHRRPGSALVEEQQQQQMLRWGGARADDSLFGGEEDRRLMEDGDASISSDELQLPELSKRREPGQSRGPTLSVVSPLEVLRQRLRLDRAKQLFRENQRQIVANEALLEKIGKRGLLIRP